MKFRIQIKHIAVCLTVIIFTVSITGISHSAMIDGDTIELAYLFDDGNENVAKDLSKNGRDGEIIGAKYGEGVFGTCLEFDGDDDNVIVTGYNGIGGSEPRTIIFWFKTTVVRAHSLVKWGVNSSGQKYYIRAHPSGNECFLRVEVNGGNDIGTDNICDGEWHHIAVVLPIGSDVVEAHDLYIDGELQETTGVKHAMGTNIETQAVNIGAKLTGDTHAFMLGSFDEVAIFNVDLSLSQIDAIRQNGLEGAASVDPQGKLATSWGMIKKY